MSKQVELRVWHVGAASKCSRAKEEGAPIKGLASVFYREGNPDTEYWLWSDMVERIMPVHSIARSRNSKTFAACSTTIQR